MLTKSDIERFYLYEKQLATYFAIACLVIAVAAVVLYFVNKQPFWRGVAVTSFVVCVAVGISTNSLRKKSDEKRKETVYAYDMNPSFFKDKELPRIEQGIGSVKNLLIGQLVVIAIGLALFFYFRQHPAQDFWRGMAMVFMAGGMIFFITDFTLKDMSEKYREKLKEFVDSNFK